MPVWKQRLWLSAGHYEALELLNHLGQQVERLGVLFNVIWDHLCRCHHLLSEIVNVLGAVLKSSSHCVNGGPELLHAGLFDELRRPWILVQMDLAAIVTRLFQACLQRSCLTQRCSARGGQGAKPRLLSGLVNSRTRWCCLSAHPSKGSARCPDVPGVSCS